MRREWVRWAWLLLCGLPLAAWAGDVEVRVAELPAAPTTMPGPAAAATDAGHTATRVWLRAPHSQSSWYVVRVDRDWQSSSQPLLVIGDNTRARVTVYMPPDYQPRDETIFDASLDPGFSHHAVVYPLPLNLRNDQPIYIELGSPGQTQPIVVRVTDASSYRADDLRHVRLSTFFVSVQVSMVLVILCFWIVLRDRMFLYFIAYVSSQVAYLLAATGELFALPGAALLGPLGYRTGQTMATLSAAFSIWFIIEFAELREYEPRLARWLGATRWPFLAFAAIVWMPFLAPDYWLANTVNSLLIVAVVLALTASWRAWRHGSRQAGFFLLSWLPLLALTVVRVVQLVAGLPLPAWLEYGFPASMAYAAVIITVGLADRTLQVRHERDHATRMAQFDPLTGVFNRGAIMARLRDAWQADDAGAAPLAALFLDLDHFKQVNDNHGHAAGDACLVAVTDAIRAELGATDHIGRYGGEEFLAVLRDDSARAARVVAERIVARVAALRVPVGDKLVALTISIGVATRDEATASVEALVQDADAAQYRAKAEGRNRVVVHGGSGFVAAPAH